MITDNKKPKIDLPHAPGPKLIYQSEICDFGTKLSYYISNEGNVKAFWEIPSFSHLRSKRPGKKVFKSPQFQTGNGDPCSILLGQSRSSPDVGVFVAIQPRSPENFKASYTMDIWFKNGFKYEKELSLSQYDTRQFDIGNETEDWGYTDFINSDEYKNQLSRHFFIEINIHPMPDGRKSRNTTGFVGLVNEGTTCYLNSLLQTLYTISDFRNAVYQMPTHDDPDNSMPLCL